ncbi:TPA: DUF3857 domain-containing protein [Candidatus Poribacteria bacterium]|nr:DUF3857 domain-containing protein [Candidatus Poribacteria bacterium]
MFMHYFKRKLILFFLFFIVLNGCSVIRRGHLLRRQETVDPFILRNRQWKEQISLADQALLDRNFPLALEAFQNALLIKPKQSHPHIEIAKIYLQTQDYEKARDAFSKYIALEPKDRNARNYLGYIHEKLGNYAAAMEQFENSLRINSRDLYALNHLGLAYKQTGRLDDAEVILRKALAIDPVCQRTESKNLHNYLALIFQERGDIGEAIAEFRESLRLFHDDVWARQQLGAIFEDKGRHFEAQIQYSKILEIDSENLFAKDRLRALNQISIPNVVKVSPVDIIEIDEEKIIEDGYLVETIYPNADAVILLNQFSHEILTNGQTRYTTHQIIKLLTYRGIKQYDDIAIPYNPDVQYLTVNQARTVLSDGSMHQSEVFNRVTPPGLLEYNLYSDTVWHVISMSALELGCTIEYQISIEDAVASGGENRFWGGFHFQSTNPTLQTNYALRLPRDRGFRWKAVNCMIEPQIVLDNEIVTYLWHYGETPAIREEVGMPNINEVVPRFSFSSFESWDEVSNWYRELAKDRYDFDPKIERIVNNLTSDPEKQHKKIRAIYNFVTGKIRYVGIELGKGAYQPSLASQVLYRRYGDCKDKTTLMISMLNQIGVEAFPVLINPSPFERIDLDIPSTGQFSHLITMIPQQDDEIMWLDPTSETCPFGTLPVSDQGRRVLVVKEETAAFLAPPIALPEFNQLIVNIKIVINSDGLVRGEMEILPTGQYDIDYRFTYKQINPINIKQTFAAELNGRFPSLQVDQVHMSDLQNLSVPTWFRIKFHVDRNMMPVANDQFLFLFPGGDFENYAEIFALPERQYSLDLSHPIKVVRSTEIWIPEGWDAILPSEVSENYCFASFGSKYSYEDNMIYAQLSLVVKNPVILPNDYPVAKEFFDQLVREDQKYFILQKKIGGT